MSQIGPHFIHVPLRQCREYTLAIEAVEVQGMIARFVHCDVYKWGARTREKILADLNRLQEMCGPIFCYQRANDKKFARFVEMMGFKPLEPVEVASEKLTIYSRG